MVGLGYKAQRAGHELLKNLSRKQTSAPPATVGKATIKEQVIHFE
jgi:hypothetical protein